MFTVVVLVQVLLGLVIDIKNNKQRNKGSLGAVSIASVLSAGVLKWLRGCGVETVQLRHLPWKKVLQPNKKVSEAALVTPEMPFRSISVLTPHSSQTRLHIGC